MRKLGLIAGGGGLPISLAAHCRTVGRPLFVLRLMGFADDALSDFDGVDIGLAELGKGMAALRSAECDAVCMAGKVERPDFRRLRPDIGGLAVIPGAIAAARRGDDALLRFLAARFEQAGFLVEGAHEVMSELTLPPGPLGSRTPPLSAQLDIQRALDAARAIGGLDIGQAAVSCEGVVLALEAQEGTDAMLERVAALPEVLRGCAAEPRGVLGKAAKPGQDLRLDLPTIGPDTVRAAVKAHLAGVVGEAGRVLVVDREATCALADEADLFIVGVD